MLSADSLHIDINRSSSPKLIPKGMSEEEEVSIMYGIKKVLSQIEQAVARRRKELPQVLPTLVCVSKIKPAPLIIEAYEAGQRHFGENYANELNEKANYKDILEKCKDIKWHFIGNLQTNKINKVLGSPGLFIVETVHSKKLADSLNKQWPKFTKSDQKLKVMVQVNTSGEDEKNGVSPADAPNLADHIMANCPNLELRGLMTIGQYGYDMSQGPNPDFITLSRCREAVSKAITVDVKDLELSMGMSTDFEHAIEMGATTVRVGTTIFGARPPKENKSFN